MRQLFIPIPALPTAEIDADVETYTERNLSYSRNIAIGNILNMCGLSVPCGFTKQGLPIGPSWFMANLSRKILCFAPVTRFRGLPIGAGVRRIFHGWCRNSAG